jgi:hypothetical protein
MLEFPAKLALAKRRFIERVQGSEVSHSTHRK